MCPLLPMIRPATSHKFLFVPYYDESPINPILLGNAAALYNGSRKVLTMFCFKASISFKKVSKKLSISFGKFPKVSDKF